MKTSVMHIRIEPQIKTEVENILKDLGLNISDAINLYFNQIILQNGIPFELKVHEYNDETIKAMNEAFVICEDDSPGYNTIEDLKKDLEDETKN